MEYVVVNEKIYHKELYPDDRGLLQAQGNKKYYIPSVKEVHDFRLYGYFPNNTETVLFKRYLIKEMNVTEEEAEVVSGIIQRKISEDCQMAELFEILEDFDLMADYEAGVDKLVHSINKLWNGTRMLLNRGFTPLELRYEEQSKRVCLENPNNIISFHEARKNKIYPNAPCPCGSGKNTKNAAEKEKEKCNRYKLDKS